MRHRFAAIVAATPFAVSAGAAGAARHGTVRHGLAAFLLLLAPRPWQALPDDCGAVVTRRSWCSTHACEAQFTNASAALMRGPIPVTIATPAATALAARPCCSGALLGADGAVRARGGGHHPGAGPAGGASPQVLPAHRGGGAGQRAGLPGPQVVQSILRFGQPPTLPACQHAEGACMAGRAFEPSAAEARTSEPKWTAHAGLLEVNLGPISSCMLRCCADMLQCLSPSHLRALCVQGGQVQATAAGREHGPVHQQRSFTVSHRVGDAALIGLAS